MPVKGLSEQVQGANMPFVSVPGLKGKIYVPEDSRGGDKKHSCQDCFVCQHCSDDRCRVCLNSRPCSCNRQFQPGKGARSKKIAGIECLRKID
jgi:hypothetical protein